MSSAQRRQNEYRCVLIHIRDGVITIQMYSSTSMILWTCMSMNTQKANVLKYEYDDFRMYSSTSTITLECNHDYFNEYPVTI